MAETQPEHWTTERMILEGHSDYATREDLEGLDESLLTDIAQICEVQTAAPDECIPCLAYAMVMERRKEAAQRALAEMAPSTPKLDDLVTEEPPWNAEEATPVWEEPPSDTITNMTDVPVIERFASAVRGLDLLVSELLEGPPIPPPNVTMEELALLVIAAQRWIRITEAQGVDLGEAQQKVLDATKDLVGRLHRGD